MQAPAPSPGALAPPALPPLVRASELGNRLGVSPRQQLNPVLKMIKNVGIAFCDCAADFHVSPEVGCLYLSMRYHLMNPHYILGRLDNLPGYKLRVVVLCNDSEGGDREMVELSCDCIAKNATLIVGFSEFECARYLETFKLYEKKTPEMIRGEQKSAAHEDVFADCVTSVKSVNKSDAAQLGTTFGTMRALASAKVEELLLCPGLGMKKARRIVDAFENPL
jgi:DNA excision repair protein ERCC-1